MRAGAVHRSPALRWFRPAPNLRSAVRLRDFFAELQRRNVYKVAVAYLVVAWLLIQAASIVFPTFGAPAWVMKVLITAAALGFLIALILAWALELTPEGLVRVENVSPNESTTRRPGRKLTAMIVVLAVVAGGLFAFRLLGPTRRAETALARLPIASATPPTSDKSIAVLPFKNLSEDKANAFLASGIQDEILTKWPWPQRPSRRQG